ncbi:MAG: NAD(P)H-quinone oxidoreductase, partial [Sphingomonas bacterium]|nr:NAD(P)H-quinone oxidoreductase [Sphingomonas bacterium]
MVNGAFHFSAGTGDFRLEHRDPLLEFLDRQRIEVLAHQLRERVARFFRQELVKIHGQNVDRRGDDVNKAAGQAVNKSMNDIPTTMNAIDPEAPGGPEVLRVVQRPVPVPGAGEVLIRVAAAGVNRPDVLQRKGGYPPPFGAPTILGLEVSGEIVALGEGVTAEMLGQPVCALLAGGGYAEYAVAPVGQCLPVPNTLTMIEAAAMPETLFTVWTNLFERAYAREDEWVLVHGGTSGIGTMAIALGALFGLKTIVTCGSDAKCGEAVRLGALHAINYKERDFVAEVKLITDGAGVQVVLDMVGGDYLPRNLECLAEEGR